MVQQRTFSGFSLIEMAIVLMVLGLLLGGVLLPLSQVHEQARRAEAKQQLDQIIDALTGFAAARGRLPCPATHDSLGIANPPVPATGAPCARQHGFVPAVTLGLAGAVNHDNLLVDPWGNPFRYSVAYPGGYTFTSGGLSLATAGTLTVCTTASASSHACTGSALTLGLQLPAVVFSMGSNWASTPSGDELENAGEAMLGNYRVSGDEVFVSRTYSNASDAPFDDLVVWLSSHVLFSKLIAAEQLP